MAVAFELLAPISAIPGTVPNSIHMPRLEAPRGPARGAARANLWTESAEFRELTDAR
eukprot:COSAG02_NODE_37886_length_436_cov_0.830861_1_plen_56_part_10